MDYAIQIAKGWNTTDKTSGYVGYVTRFEVEDEYVSKFEVKIVGAKVHEELWVPAQELNEFNSHIIGKIEVVKAFHSIPFMMKAGYEGQQEEWNELIQEVLNSKWTFNSSFRCHEHCELCYATLCSEHSVSSGLDWSVGYTSTKPEGDHRFEWYLCPPCFEVLAEEHGLEASN